MVVVLDSINTLLVYSSEHEVAKFIEFITSRLRAEDVAGVMLGLEGHALADVEKLISPTVDKVVRLE